MPPRRPRSSTVSSTNAPETPFRRTRPRRHNSALDRNLAALRNINICVDSSDVSIDPASSPTVTSFSGQHSPAGPRAQSLTRAESEQSEGGFQQRDISHLPPLRRRNGRGEAASNGVDVSKVATAKGTPWTSDDLERLYRTVKMTRRDLGWAAVGERIGDRTAGECTVKWKEVEGRIIEFIRSMGEARNTAHGDRSGNEENDDRFGDDEWEADELGSDDVCDEEEGLYDEEDEVMMRDDDNVARRVVKLAR